MKKLKILYVVGLLIGLVCVLSSSAMAASKMLEKDELTLGFIKLTDCAALIVAKEKGFFEEEGNGSDECGRRKI